MYRKYVVNNVRRMVSWVETKELEFTKRRQRMTKRNRNRTNDAVAFLKGIGWLKPKSAEMTTMETVTVNLQELNHFIRQNFHELIRRYNVREAIVLMGSQEFYELSRTMLNHPMRIALADFQVGKPQNEFMGMSIVVLPWMQGTVLVPKEYFPIERELVPSGVMVTAETQRKLDEEAEGRRAAAMWNSAMGREPIDFDQE